MRLKILFLISLIAFVVNCFAADTNRLTGIYSDMEFNPESGDVVGLEVILVFSRDGYFVVFQNSEGSPSVPIVAPAKVEAGKIQFEGAIGDGVSTFNGEVLEGVLVGEFSGGVLNKDGQRLFLLRKKQSYWQ
jgi:hypothetical protein